MDSKEVFKLMCSQHLAVEINLKVVIMINVVTTTEPRNDCATIAQFVGS